MAFQLPAYDDAGLDADIGFIGDEQFDAAVIDEDAIADIDI